MCHCSRGPTPTRSRDRRLRASLESRRPLSTLHRVKLTVTVITRDEGRNIEAALQSVAWADEIVVVDSGSTDDTVVDRAPAGVHVSKFASGPDTARRRITRAEIASNDWILSLDADERVSPELAAEIREMLRKAEPHALRLSHSAGDVVPGAVDPFDRLVSRTTSCGCTIAARRAGTRAVSTNRLKPIERRASFDTSSSITPTATSRIIWPRSIATRRLRPSSGYPKAVAPVRFELFFHPRFAFIRNYILRGGFRDGAAGLLVSRMNAYYVFLKLAKLWELHAVNAGQSAATISDRNQLNRQSPNPQSVGSRQSKG